MRYLLIVLLILSSDISAFDLCGENPKDDRWLRAGLWSRHYNTDTKHNETHNQLGIDYGRCTLMYMKNSNYDNTIVVVRKSMWDIYKREYVKVDAGVMYGIFVAEDNYIGNIPAGPVFMPVVQFEWFERVGIDINIVPTYLVAIGFRFKF